ncbi:MAG: hypothetical protein CM15mV4_3080 [Caudoviricetes sp.]|nr:MAG: hypothetical protein CM15mV4_3080 [Caudoviricetes sp.]
MTPAAGTTPNGFPCTSPRVAISTSTKVFFGGRRVCKVGDFLNTTTGLPSCLLQQQGTLYSLEFCDIIIGVTRPLIESNVRLEN